MSDLRTLLQRTFSLVSPEAFFLILITTKSPKAPKGHTAGVLSSGSSDEFTNVLNFLGLHRPLVLNYDGFHKIPFSVDIEPAALTICKYWLEITIFLEKKQIEPLEIQWSFKIPSKVCTPTLNSFFKRMYLHSLEWPSVAWFGITNII